MCKRSYNVSAGKVELCIFCKKEGVRYDKMVDLTLLLLLLGAHYVNKFTSSLQMHFMNVYNVTLFICTI